MTTPVSSETTGIVWRYGAACLGGGLPPPDGKHDLGASVRSRVNQSVANADCYSLMKTLARARIRC